MILTAFLILVNLLLLAGLVKAVRALLWPKPTISRKRFRDGCLGDIKGWNVISTANGTTITRQGKVIYKSTARGVEIDRRGEFREKR